MELKQKLSCPAETADVSFPYEIRMSANVKVNGSSVPFCFEISLIFGSMDYMDENIHKNTNKNISKAISNLKSQIFLLEVS